METAVKERPILFSAPMVRAILEGRKTQTRRVVRWSVKSMEHEGCELHEHKGGGLWPYNCSDGNERPIKCPYGQKGERLWVRETAWMQPNNARMFYIDGTGKTRYGKVINPDPMTDVEMRRCGWKLRPSIHMPRWASRITLEVTSVRVERLKGISETDSIAEGCVPDDSSLNPNEIGPAKAIFEGLWESINGPGSWDANPWVWVIEFRRLQP